MTQDVSRFRWRMLAACMLLTGLAMTQSPGLLVADTKLDLVIAPLDFLARAAHLWDGEGAFGQLQNQAYGYLWPMGPFFALGFLLDVPGWVVQRLWMALVLCVAFVGTAKVARALGVRSDLACIVAGLAFALSPRMLTVLGPSSIEVWPMALTPWVLLPLVIGAERGSPRRAAALSALAIAMVGGVNAAATSAVLPLGALWLLTRTPGPRRRALMLWWPTLTLFATLWWLVPLFLLGAYSPPFLDYIESSANTTFPTTIFDSLRGTSNWVPYIDPVSRAGNDLLRQSHVITNSAVVMALGLVGLTLPGNRHRGFLALGLLTGLFLVGMGHLGAVQGWFAPALQDLLDGALAPLRNVHKFDPVVRLPMVVGLAFVVDELAIRLAEARTGHVRDAASQRLNMRLLIGICTIAVLGASLPAALGRISPAGGFSDVPDYWHAAADWLEEEQDEGVALLVPGSSFGTYVWGSPRDEPFQAIASKPWAVRNAVPLTPPGNIRMLDAVESRLAQGRGGSGLATYLARAGVSHLVLRNDLTRSPDIPDPVLVHQALADSPGIERVSTFGPKIGGAAQIEGELGKALVNGGWQTEYPAVEVYAVDQDVARVTAMDEPVAVVGGPEDLLDLAELGVVDDQPVRLAADLTEGDDPAGVVLTDGLRAVERNFGRLHDASSQTRVEGQERNLPSRSPDYQLDDPARWSTRAVFEGAHSVTASSSQADASAFGAVEPGKMPFAALDGDPTTEWLSGSGDGHWWQVDFDGARDLGRTAVTVGLQGREVLRLRTEDWTSPPLTFDPGDTRTVTVPAPSRWLRVEDVSGRAGNRLSLAEVAHEGPRVERVLVLPELPAGSPTPDAVVLRRVSDDRAGCARVDGDVRCRNGSARAAEEPRGFARRFTLPAAMTAPVSIAVSALPGREWDDYLLADQPVSIAASSSVTPDQRTAAVAAVDGSPSTTWIAGLGDTQPELRLNWLGRRTVSGLAVSVSPGTAARRPQSFRLAWPGGDRTVRLDSQGSVRFPPVRTSQLWLRVLDAEPATDIDFSGAASFVPVGISELRVVGLPFVPVILPTAERTTRCGTGPDVRINTRTYRTRVTASPAAVFDGDQARAELCGGDEVRLRVGANDVEVADGSAFVVDSIVLGGAPSSAPAVQARSTTPSPTELRVEDPGAGRHVATNTNTNPGWEAREGRALASTRVYDGWRQGWQVSTGGGDSPLEARFAPDAGYRAGLLIGALCLLLVVLAALRRPRRHEAPALASRRASPVLLLALALAAGGLLAGTVGVMVAAGAVLLAALASRVAPVTGTTWLVALLLLPAAGAYVFRPWGDSAGWAGSWAWPHYLALAACASVLGGIAADSWRRHRSEMRVPGTSTTR